MSLISCAETAMSAAASFISSIAVVSFRRGLVAVDLCRLRCRSS